MACPTSSLRLVTSERVVDESRRNLLTQHAGTISLLETFLTFHITTVADSTEETVRQVAQIIVAKDVPIVAAAIDSGSDAIATCDRKHLISLGASIERLWSIRTLTPIEILSTMRE